MLRARQERVLLTRRCTWGAVAALSLDQLVAWGVLYYAYTVLSVPMALELGVSRLHVAAAFSICLLIAGWLGRYIGPVLDARGTRGVLRAGAIAAPLGFGTVALAADVASLVVAFALLGVVQGLALYEPAFRTIVDWCPEERMRSRAMRGLTMVGGFASAVFLPLTGWLLTRHGWRETVLLLAMILALVLIPTRFSLPLSSHGHARSTTLAVRALPSATRLAVGFALHSLASTGVFVYLMWYLVERGLSFAGATAIASLAGTAQVPGRILSEPLRRAVGGAAFLPVLLVAQAVALSGVIVSQGTLATAWILVFGAVSGMMTLERVTVIVEWYGRASFGAHQGRLATATGTARAISPFIVEAGHRFVSYAVVFGLLGIVLAVGAWICQAAASERASELRVELT